MKRLFLLTAVIALLCVGGIAQANVFLNDIDYGVNLVGAIAAAGTDGVVEFRDNGSYSIAGQNHLTKAGVTVRSAAGYKATILATDGGTNSTFMLEAANITFQNLNIVGTTYALGSGTYAFGFYGTKDSDYNYPTSGLTIQDVAFSNVRGVIDAGSGWVKDLTFVNNTVTNTNYGLGKSGMNYGGGVVITGNTFINNGIGTGSGPQPAIWIEKNRGSLVIDGNTFDNYNGRYAIYSNADLSANPITLGTNDFGTGIGGTGALYNLYALQSGYAVGLMNAASVQSGNPAVPEPMSIMLGIMGLGSVAGFRKLRRK